MSKETYRIEIPIETVDKYSKDLEKAEKEVKDFEKVINKTEKSASKLKKSADIASERIIRVGDSASKSETRVSKFQASIDRTKRRLDQLRSSRGWEFTIKARDRASKVISSINSFTHRVAGRSYSFTVRAIDMASRTVRSIGRMITSIPAVITVALSVVGVSKLSEATVGAAMNFEQYEVSMTHWLDGNTKKAKELITWMGQFADSTPFSSPDLFPALTSGVNLAGGNIPEAQRLLKIASDMAALTPGTTPMDAMDALADARMGEFERMKSFNMDVSKKQYEAMGGWEGFLKKAGDTFLDGAKKLSNTSLGILLTLRGYQGSILRSLGEGFLDPMKPRLDAINQWLADNQETWGRWKATVNRHGENVSEWVFSRLETGFKFIRSRYLDNDEFMNMDFKGKFNFVMSDINEWWNSKGKPAVSNWWKSTGQPWAVSLGTTIGEAIFSGIVTGIKTGLSTIGDMWGDVADNAQEHGVFSQETAASAGGASIATLGAGAVAAMVLSPLLKGGKKIWDVGKWGYDKTFGRNKSATPKPSTPSTPTTPKTTPDKPSTGTKPTTPSTKPSSPKPVIVDQYGKPISSESSKPSTPSTKSTKPTKTNEKWTKNLNPKHWEMPKWLEKINPKNMELPKGTGKWLKRIPVIGTAVSALTLASSSLEDIPGLAGGLAGGWAGMKLGAMGGAALGTIVPGVGNVAGGVIGGLGGGIAGAIGGEKLVNWIADKFGSKGVKASEPSVTQLPDTSMALTEMRWQLSNSDHPMASAYTPVLSDLNGLNGNTQFSNAPMNALSESAAVAANNMNLLSMYLAQASGWVVGGLYSVQEIGNLIKHNANLLSSYLGQASGWVVGGLYGVQDSGNLVTHNASLLSMYLGQASGWVVGGFYNVQSAGALVVRNASLLSSYLGQASGWVVGGIHGIQASGNQVKTALNNLATRIRNVSVPSSVGGTSSPSTTPNVPKYANGGIISRPHLGLVGEAGPEMIIPLSSGRRNRAMELFQRTGQMLGVRKYANGGLVGAEPLVNMSEPTVSTSGGTVSVDISAPISLMFDGSSGIDDERVKDVVLNELNKFVTNVKEELSNMTR